MFGSVARMRLKESVTDAQLQELVDTMTKDRPPSGVALLLYRSSSNPRELWVAGAFESREAYNANANTPEQNARFQRLSALLDGPPEWHDGDVLVAVATDRVRAAT